MRRQVLILGAGASVDYGLPVGTDLRQGVFNNFFPNLEEWFRLGNSSPLDHQDVVEFVNAFRHSPLSIDQFTEIRRGNLENCKDISNYAITYLISYSEDPEKLFLAPPKSHWLGEFWRILNAGINTAEDFIARCQSLTIISFNYDRALEYFLYHAISNTYPEIIDSTLEAEDNLFIKIHHVYGTISRLKNLAYSDRLPINGLRKGEINLINEARLSKDTTEIRKSIQECDTLLFLGFSYQQENLAVLGFPDVTRPNVRVVLGTSLGLFPEEIGRIAPRIKVVNPYSSDFLLPVDCSELIRRFFYVD